MIVGTAGHIDHGKSSLVRALTGIDTDRLKEEKARGITIELGFAYLPRPSGETIGFVDVPGHERLVHTMLAGAAGIDFVLLAVAADDGVMPQTREHLAIVDLLGIRRGVIALTKRDLVPGERLAEVAAEIMETVAGSGLAGADIVPVSAFTGEGIADLLAHLDRAAATTAARAAEGRFRLAVDRAFSLAGAGTVVTGTALCGRVCIGDAVIVSPAGLEARVRSIHAQNRSASEGRAGQRCAIALVGPKINTESVGRGQVVLEPSLHSPVKRLDATLALLTTERKNVGSWMPVKFHCGSLERDARVLALRSGGSIAPGETDFVQIQLAEPAPLAAGDRYVLRDTSATRTIGGGVLLDLAPPERHRTTPTRRAELAALTDADPVTALAKLLAAGRGFVEIEQHFRQRASAQEAAEGAAESLGLVTLASGTSRIALLPERWSAYRASAVAVLDTFHAEKPDLPGIGQERLRLALAPRLPAPAFADALRRMSASGEVVLDRSWVRRPHHEVRLSPEEERLWQLLQPLISGDNRFRPPRVRDIAKARNLDEGFVRRLFKLAARRGDVDEIAQDHYFLADTVVEMADIVRNLARTSADGQFAVVDFRDRLDNGRKVAIQILEFFDRQGLTMRRGDIRRVNPHKSQLFSRRTAAGVDPVRVGGEAPPVGRPDFKSGEGRETALGGFDSCLLRQSSTGGRR